MPGWFMRTIRAVPDTLRSMLPGNRETPKSQEAAASQAAPNKLTKEQLALIRNFTMDAYAKDCNVAAAGVDPSSFKYFTAERDNRGVTHLRSSLDNQRLNYLYQVRQAAVIAAMLDHEKAYIEKQVQAAAKDQSLLRKVAKRAKCSPIEVANTIRMFMDTRERGLAIAELTEDGAELPGNTAPKEEWQKTIADFLTQHKAKYGKRLLHDTQHHYFMARKARKAKRKADDWAGSRPDEPRRLGSPEAMADAQQGLQQQLLPPIGEPLHVPQYMSYEEFKQKHTLDVIEPQHKDLIQDAFWRRQQRQPPLRLRRLVYGWRSSQKMRQKQTLETERNRELIAERRGAKAVDPEEAARARLAVVAGRSVSQYTYDRIEDRLLRTHYRQAKKQHEAYWDEIKRERREIIRVRQQQQQQ